MHTLLFVAEAPPCAIAIHKVFMLDTKSVIMDMHLGIPTQVISGGFQVSAEFIVHSNIIHVWCTTPTMHRRKQYNYYTMYNSLTAVT